MATVDYKKVLRDEGVNRAGIAVQLLTRQLGVSLSDKVIGYKDSSGIMSWYIPEGGVAKYSSVQITGLTGSGPIVADENGNLSVSTITATSKSVISNIWTYKDATPSSTEFTADTSTITINKTSKNGLYDYLLNVLFSGSSITLQDQSDATVFSTIQLADVATIDGDNYTFSYYTIHESTGFALTIDHDYLFIFDIVASQVFDGDQYDVMVNDGSGQIYGSGALQVRDTGGFASIPRITNNGRVDMYSTDGSSIFDAKLHGYSSDGSPYIHYTDFTGVDSQEINFGLNAFNITTHGNTNIELRPAETIQIKMNNDDRNANTAPRIEMLQHDGSPVLITYDKTYASWIAGLVYAPGTTNANIDADTYGNPLITKEYLQSKLYDTEVNFGTEEQVSVNHALSHIWSSTTAPDEGFDITENGDGTFDLSAGFAYIKNSTSDSINYYSVGAESNVLLQNNATSYVYIYLAGGVTPTVGYTTDINIITQTGNAFLYVISRIDNALNILDIRGLYDGFMANYARYNVAVDGFDKVSGSALSVNASHQIALTQGLYYTLNLPFTTPAIDTSVSGTFTYAYSDGAGGWTRVPGSTAIDFDGYDNGTGTVGLVANNKYGVHWLYAVHNTPSHYLVQYGVDEYDNLEDALASGLPNRPPEVSSYSTGDAIWKIVYTGDGTLREIVDLHLSPVGNAVTIDNHNELTGLQGGAVSEYYHLTAAELSEVQNLSTNYYEKVPGLAIEAVDGDTNHLGLRATGADLWLEAEASVIVNLNNDGSTADYFKVRDDSTGNTMLEVSSTLTSPFGRIRANSGYVPSDDADLTTKAYVDGQTSTLVGSSLRSLALGIPVGDEEYITKFLPTVDWSLNAITLFPSDTAPGNYWNNARVTVAYNDTVETAIIDNNRNDIRVTYEQRSWDDSSQTESSWHIESGNNTTQSTLNELFIVFDTPPTGEYVFIKMENCTWAGNPYEILLTNITGRTAYNRDGNLIGKTSRGTSVLNVSDGAQGWVESNSTIYTEGANEILELGSTTSKNGIVSAAGGVSIVMDDTEDSTSDAFFVRSRATDGDIVFKVVQNENTTIGGVAEVPNCTNTKINSVGSKALITKEYADANYSGGSSTPTQHCLFSRDFATTPPSGNQNLYSVANPNGAEIFGEGVLVAGTVVNAIGNFSTFTTSAAQTMRFNIYKRTAGTLSSSQDSGNSTPGGGIQIGYIEFSIPNTSNVVKYGLTLEASTVSMTGTVAKGDQIFCLIDAYTSYVTQSIAVTLEIQ